MVSYNRQCFFLTENRPSFGADAETTLPWKNTRNYMNRMTVSEHDQFEISGFFAIPVGTSDREREGVKEESKNISAQVIKQLSTLSGIVHVLVSGISLCYRQKNEGRVSYLHRVYTIVYVK